MKNATILLVLITLMLSSWACKDHFTIQYDNYSNLEVGNYWVYDVFTLKTDGSLIPQDKTDSIYIAKDTLIGANTYFKLRYPEFPSGLYTHIYLRDSLHYVVDASGKIHFSSENFTDVFYRGIRRSGVSPFDTICSITSQMADDNTPVIVPAGTFSTKNYQTTYRMQGKWTYNGTLRSLNTRYAKEVGVIEETLPFYIGDPNYTIRRLKRYRHQ